MIIAMIIFILAITTLSSASPVRNQRQIPCGHPLRISRPELFTHCDCTNVEWSQWEIVEGSTVSVPTSQCESGEAFDEQRRKLTTLGDNCPIEIRRVCVPDASDKLIIALGLGGSNQDYSPVENVIPPGPAPPAPRPRPRPRPPSKNTNFAPMTITSDTDSITIGPQHCPRSGRDPQVCHHLTEKRSAEELSSEKMEDKRAAPQKKIDSSLSNDEDPIMQFSWEEHSHRFRRQVRQCGSDDVQHVLFVLDSSGSIDARDFNRMKTAVATLTTYFCKKVKFGLITFSTDIHLDFCFNCFQNTYSGREAASNAIKAAEYLNQWTRTGDTAKCICEEVLRPTCGITSSPDCLDVVFITDGKSNHGCEVCDEIRCLHGRLGINTYAIGIGNYDQAELDCIADGSNRLSSFQFNDFDDFETAIRKVGERLVSVFGKGKYLSCAALNGDVDPTGGINPFN